MGETKRYNKYSRPAFEKEVNHRNVLELNNDNLAVWFSFSF